MHVVAVGASQAKPLLLRPAHLHRDGLKPYLTSLDWMVWSLVHVDSGLDALNVLRRWSFDRGRRGHGFLHARKQGRRVCALVVLRA